MKTTDTVYLVKDLARASGHSIYTVEHYLKEGLLKELGRSPHTKYRFFDVEAVHRLLRIRELRKQGCFPRRRRLIPTSKR